jgi:two-component system phosphate regulon response regulator PhoB
MLAMADEPVVQHIAVLDDEPDITTLLANYLHAQGFRVSVAHRGEALMALMTLDTPALVLLDLGLPGEDGFAIARRLREHWQCGLVILTGRGDAIDKVVGLEIGADDYVTKPFDLRELLARIKAVLRRRAPQVTEEIAEIGGLRLDPVTHRITADGQLVSLGPTEFRLLHFLLTHAERVHSRTQLLDQVWGDHVFVEERTVDVHIRRLRAALEAGGKQALIQTVRGSGYRLSATPAAAD